MKAISWVKALPLRLQAAFIGIAYAAVLAYGAMAKYARYLAEIRDPAAAAASSGMWAFGDELLAWNIFVFFMVPTFFLLLLVRQHEDVYVKYSNVLFWFSLTAPLSLAIVVLGNVMHWRLTDPLLWRTWRGPFGLILIAMSRILAVGITAKRLLTRAALIEGGAFAILVALIVFWK